MATPSKFPSNFLNEFKKVCDQVGSASKNSKEISEKVFTELQMDFPQITMDELEIFLEYMSNQDKNSFFPNKNYIDGLLSIQSPENIIKITNILFITIIKPILILLKNPNENLEKISLFLSLYNIESINDDQIKNQIEFEQEIIQTNEINDQNDNNNYSDPDDFEWESYDSPKVEIEFKEIKIYSLEEKNQSQTLQLNWDEKVANILLSIDQSIWETLFTSIELKDKNILELINNTIQGLFELLNNEFSSNEQILLSKIENIQKIISQLIYLLQNFMNYNDNKILVQICENLKMDENLYHSNVNCIKQAFMLNFLSKVIDRSNENKSNKQINSYLVDISKSQLELIKNRIIFIHNLIKQLLQSENEKLNLSSASIIELTEIINILKFIVKTEKGQLDSLIYEELINGQILQNLILLLISIHKMNEKSFIVFEFIEQCNDFLIYSSIYQPSIAIYMTKVKGLQKIFSSSEFLNEYPHHYFMFHLISYRNSKYKSNDNLLLSSKFCVVFSFYFNIFPCRKLSL